MRLISGAECALGMGVMGNLAARRYVPEVHFPVNQVTYIEPVDSWVS